MDIGEKIRKYRKAAGLTQEQVAGYLGVSAPAVHKWEKGSSCPDISLLPALARLLKTDLNELFSFREELTEWEIDVFVRQLTDRGMNGDVEGAFSLAEEKIREYPHCHLLLYQAASVLNGILIFSAEEKNEEHEQQITQWLERAVVGSSDKVRLPALYMLALRLMQKESYEEAQTLLDQIPDGDIDKVLPMTTILIKIRRHFFWRGKFSRQLPECKAICTGFWIWKSRREIPAGRIRSRRLRKTWYPFLASGHTGRRCQSCFWLSAGKTPLNVSAVWISLCRKRKSPGT